LKRRRAIAAALRPSPAAGALVVDRFAQTSRNLTACGRFPVEFLGFFLL